MSGKSLRFVLIVVAGAVVALCLWVVGQTALACPHLCIETLNQCQGTWQDGNPGGWNMIVSQFDPYMGEILYDPNGWSATPDNSFVGSVRIETGYRSYPLWPCKCTPPTQGSQGEVPSTGGWTCTVTPIDLTYPQYCNSCIP